MLDSPFGIHPWCWEWEWPVKLFYLNKLKFRIRIFANKKGSSALWDKYISTRNHRQQNTNIWLHIEVFIVITLFIKHIKAYFEWKYGKRRTIMKQDDRHYYDLANLDRVIEFTTWLRPGWTDFKVIELWPAACFAEYKLREAANSAKLNGGRSQMFWSGNKMNGTSSYQPTSRYLYAIYKSEYSVCIVVDSISILAKMNSC